LVYLGIIKYQKFILTHELDRLLHLPREEVSLRPSIIKGKRAYFIVDPPTKYLDLINSKADSMTPEIANKGPQWDVRAAGERFYLINTDDKCASKMDISIVYKHTNEVWQPLDFVIKLPAPLNTSITTGVLFTGFYRPTQFFNGISVPEEFEKCKFKLYIIKGYSRIPLIFSASTENDKVYGNQIKRMGGFAK